MGGGKNRARLATLQATPIKRNTVAAKGRVTLIEGVSGIESESTGCEIRLDDSIASEGRTLPGNSADRPPGHGCRSIIGRSS